MEASPAPAAARRPFPGARAWSDHRTERLLGAVACTVLVLIAGMVVFVFAKDWPSFANNGLAWFGSGTNVDTLLTDIFNSPANPEAYVYEMRAWPLIYGTFITTAGAVVIGVVFATFAAIFIVEIAPDRLRSVL